VGGVGHPPVLFLFSRFCWGEVSRKGDDIARVKLRKRCNTGSATSKPEPFLHKAQKRFGTRRVSIVQGVHSGAARKGWPPAARVHSGAARKDSPPAAGGSDRTKAPSVSHPWRRSAQFENKFSYKAYAMRPAPTTRYDATALQYPFGSSARWTQP
jgi:hypothetical protein